jgi:hypothetical protein
LTTANTPSTLLAPSRRDSALAVHTERTIEAAARHPTQDLDLVYHGME